MSCDGTFGYAKCNVLMYQLRLLLFNECVANRGSSQLMKWFLLQPAKVTLALPSGRQAMILCIHGYLAH